MFSGATNDISLLVVEEMFKQAVYCLMINLKCV